MPPILHRYATPLTTGLFLVSLVSGVALFFHFGSAFFHGMHEWLSMVLIVPFALHIWRNWRAFASYFKRPPMAVGLAVSTVAALVFVWPQIAGGGGGGGMPPQRAAIQAIQNGTVAQVAPLFGHTPESLSEKLKAGGFTVASPDDTLGAIASTSKRNAMEAIALAAAK
ncbi:MAG TPA: DUF4405 domain-containing protein [Rhizobiaceae bacterium]|nr:DUF4405 domain-containing protein [Rhizobiaceae bacterium]